LTLVDKGSQHLLWADIGLKGFRSACSIADFGNKESHGCNVASTSSKWASVIDQEPVVGSSIPKRTVAVIRS
jgi:hypothetical protein